MLDKTLTTFKKKIKKRTAGSEGEVITSKKDKQSVASPVGSTVVKNPNSVEEGQPSQQSGPPQKDKSKGAAPKSVAKPFKRKRDDKGSHWTDGQEWSPGAWSADAESGAWVVSQPVPDKKWDKHQGTMSSSQIYNSGAKSWSGNKGYDEWGQHL